MNRFYIFCVLAAAVVLLADVSVTRHAHQEHRRLQEDYLTLQTNAWATRAMLLQATEGWLKAEKQRDDFRAAWHECLAGKSGVAMVIPATNQVNITNFTITYYLMPEANQTNQP